MRDTPVEGHDVCGVPFSVLYDVDALVVHVRHLAHFETVCKALGDLAARALEFLESSLVRGELFGAYVALVGHIPG